MPPLWANLGLIPNLSLNICTPLRYCHFLCVHLCPKKLELRTNLPLAITFFKFPAEISSSKNDNWHSPNSVYPILSATPLCPHSQAFSLDSSYSVAAASTSSSASIHQPRPSSTNHRQNSSSSNHGAVSSSSRPPSSAPVNAVFRWEWIGYILKIKISPRYIEGDPNSE